MYTRKINLKELILELDCLDESTVEALENTETGIESYTVEYTVTRKGEDDYTISPTPYDVAEECSNVFFGTILDIGKWIGYLQLDSVRHEMQKDAEWWEGENRDMLIELSEDRFDG